MRPALAGARRPRAGQRDGNGRIRPPSASRSPAASQRRRRLGRRGRRSADAREPAAEPRRQPFEAPRGAPAAPCTRARSPRPPWRRTPWRVARARAGTPRRRGCASASSRIVDAARARDVPQVLHEPVADVDHRARDTRERRRRRRRDRAAAAAPSRRPPTSARARPCPSPPSVPVTTTTSPRPRAGARDERGPARIAERASP